jgi:mono/diheme cytochrome c family protein
VLKSEGLHLAAYDPHPGKEFLASSDERFRPVHLSQGPDGALYVVDMYRGLIQHKAYVTPYLKEQTLSRKLEQPINRGRIWRIVPEDWEPKKSTRLSQKTSGDLVGLLSSDDGWYRDMAQRLLVERNDKTVIPLLEDVARAGQSPLSRFHALWTLKGMNALDGDLVFEKIKDPDAWVSTTALRLVEDLAKTDERSRQRLQDHMLDEWDNASSPQVLQMTLTANVLGEKASHDLLLRIATTYDTSALMRDAVLSSIGGQEFAFMRKVLASPEWQTQKPSREIFLEMLTSCVVRKADATEVRGLLTMLDTPKGKFGWHEKTILTGMSIQGYAGKVKPLKLVSQPRILKRSDIDVPESQLQGLASLFQWPGSVVRDTTRRENTLTNEEKEQFALGRKFYLSSCSGCHGNDGAGLNRFAPPLRGSEWVVGDEKKLALIVLHGIEGPLEVAGKRYAEPEILPVMPGHSTLDDGTLAAILTYIRNEWGNHAPAVTRRGVGTVRLTNQGRVLPWTSEELERHLAQPAP